MDRLCMGCMEKYDDRFEVCPHCGYAFNTPPKQSYHLTPGSILEQKYIVGKVLGFGGFGVTYIGWDYLMERKVAIKEYLPSEFATRMPTQQKVTVYSGDKEEQFREGLVKTVDEARRLAKFESVPGIVQIYDCFEANGTSYIVMEYLEGMSLKEYLAQHGKMSVEQAAHVVEQIASAMEAVHKTGILHRDIAPDNIYVLNPDEPDNLQVKLLDFGAARYATTKHSKSLSVIIKPGYAPEEQYRSRGDQGTWTDVYALAATLYKMLTGVTPEDAMERAVKDEVKRPSKMGVKISRPMETALMNALNVKIQDRTQTMGEFSQELMAAEVKERRITKTKSDVGSVPKWIFAAAILGIAAVAGGGAFLISRIGQNWGHSRIASDMARVPNVVNQSVEEATEILSRTDSRLGLNTSRAEYSDEIPADRISYQEIKENSLVQVPADLVVWVSLGEETFQMPSILGLQREDAEAALKEAGFTNVEFVESQEEGQYNAVLAASEEAGTSVSPKTTITVTVCMNEASLAEDASVQAEVPDAKEFLPGQAEEENQGISHEQVLADAEAVFEEAGLHVTWIEENSDTVEAGAVISQDPAAGEMANRDSYVVIRVSLGRAKVNIALKDVLYQPQQDAESAIQSQNLIVGGTAHEYSDTVAKGSVIRVTDAEGNRIENGTSLDAETEVTLVISDGKDPAKQTTAARRETEAQTAAPTQAPAQTQPPQTAAPETTPAPTQPETTAPPQTQPQTEAAPPETQAPEPTQNAGGMPDINF